MRRMKNFSNLLIALLHCLATYAQTPPEIASWIINTNGQTGYGGILSNVQQVQYSSNNVYVSCTCIPGYDIGPWQANPNTPVNQNFIFKIGSIHNRVYIYGVAKLISVF